MTDIEQIAYKMLLIRRVEEEIIARYPKQLMRCPVHLSIGQEAIAVGVCHHLRKYDKVFSTHRNHAHYLARGGSLEKMALELHGKADGCNGGRGGSMHLQDTDVNVFSIPIVASAIPLAVGVALANKIDGKVYGNIVVCFFGDAAVEEGVFHESINFASLMQLPIIFVCENNQYSVDTHISKRQPSYNMSTMMAHKISVLHMDGGNVFAVANAFTQVISGARNGHPVFVVLDTQRSHVHCGVDKEFELENDPVEIASRKFTHDSLENIRFKNRSIEEIDKRITAAFDAAELAPLPTPDMAARYVYA